MSPKHATVLIEPSNNWLLGQGAYTKLIRWMRDWLLGQGAYTKFIRWISDIIYKLQASRKSLFEELDLIKE